MLRATRESPNLAGVGHRPRESVALRHDEGVAKPDGGQGLI